MPYSLDTSGFLDAWVRNYPPDVFPTVWDNMDAASKAGNIFVIDEVVRELEKKDDGAHEWIKARSSIVVAIDADIQKSLIAIMTQFPRLVDTKKNRSVGDPWVIALAETKGLTVVTGEKASNSLDKPKIPDVCAAKKIRHIGVVEFFREQGWKI